MIFSFKIGWLIVYRTLGSTSVVYSFSREFEPLWCSYVKISKINNDPCISVCTCTHMLPLFTCLTIAFYTVLCICIFGVHTFAYVVEVMLFCCWYWPQCESHALWINDINSKWTSKHKTEYLTHHSVTFNSKPQMFIYLQSWYEQHGHPSIGRDDRTKIKFRQKYKPLKKI